MRIALITPGFSANEYDWCIPVLRNLARDLAQSHEISVYALTYPSFAKDYEVAGVPVTSFGDGRTGLVAQIRRLTRAYRRLRADHNQRPFAVLHGFWADQGGLLDPRSVVLNYTLTASGTGSERSTVTWGRLAVRPWLRQP